MSVNVQTTAHTYSSSGVFSLDTGEVKLFTVYVHDASDLFSSAFLWGQ